MSAKQPKWINRVQRGGSLHEQVEEEAYQESERVKTFEAKVGKLAEKEDLRHTPQRDDYDVKRRIQIYSDVFGDEPQLYPTPVRKLPDERHPRTNQEWEIKDLRDNILHRLWEQKYWTESRGDLDQIEWNEVVIARALLRMLAYIPNAYNLLVPMYCERDAHTIPKHEDAVRFINVYMDTGLDTDANTVDDSMLREHELRPLPQRNFIPVGGYDESEDFLSLVYGEVPGMKRAVYRVLRRYRERVILRHQTDVEQNNSGTKPIDGYLPYDEELPPEYFVTWEGLIDSFGFTKADFVADPDDLAMELAVSAVRRGMALTKAFKQYGVPRNQLRARLEQLGIPINVGRKAKIK